MRATLEIHLELDDDRQFVWWASSPDLAGFYVAADHLPQLLAQAGEAAAEMAGEPVELVPTVVQPDGDPSAERSGMRALATA